MKHVVRTAAGLLVWGFAVIAVAPLLFVAKSRQPSTAEALWDYLRQDPERIVLMLRVNPTNPDYRNDPLILSVGSLVYVNPGEAGEAETVVGEVEALLDADGQPLSTLFAEVPARCVATKVRLYDASQHLTLNGKLRSDASAQVIRVPLKFNWVVNTLLTDEASQQVLAEWNLTMLRHREEFFTLLTPVVRDFIHDMEKLAESQLPAFIEKHRAEVRRLRDDLEQNLGGDKLVKLFHKEVWPLAETKLRPVAEEIGAELWKKFPVWSLSWRLAYGKLPLTSEEHFDKAWDKFVEAQIVPVLKEHSPKLLAVIREIGSETLTKPAVKEHLRSAFSELLENPRFQVLAQDFVKEFILDNAEFHALVRRQWDNPALRRAVQRAGTFLEPMLRRMGDIVLGTRGAGITPEFARVLRSQILLKDQQRIMLSPGSSSVDLQGGKQLEAEVVWEVSR